MPPHATGVAINVKPLDMGIHPKDWMKDKATLPEGGFSQSPAKLFS